MAETLRFRADTTGKLYTLSGTPPSGTPSDGSVVMEWRDEQTPGSRDRSIVSSGGPTWKNPGPMLLPSIYFDGNDMYSTLQVDSTSSSSSTYLGASGSGSALLHGSKSIIIAFRLSLAATNNANIYDNTPLIVDTGGLTGIHFKTVAGVHSIIGYNWDGTADVTSGITISLNTDYVVQYRHDGTNLNMSVLSGAGGASRTNQSVASGSTSNASGRNLRIARVYNATATYFTGYIGEIYCDDTDVGATSTPLNEIVGRWLPAAASSSGNMLLMF